MNAITQFTPYAGLVGGGLIGLSAVLLMGGAGRIAGCSGIFRHMLTLNFNNEFVWRGLFIIGLVVGAFVAGPYAVNAQNLAFQPFTATIIGGLLVGFGTALSHGCTSGHGVCGIARFSMRSIVATLTFLVVAIITVYVTHHVMGG